MARTEKTVMNGGFHFLYFGTHSIRIFAFAVFALGNCSIISKCHLLLFDKTE